MTIPADYNEKVYAGVLGKIIGVYLGRPFEGWSCERLTERFGEVEYYVHDQLGAKLIVADDDISGTFTFLRALPDFDYDANLSPAQIGETWLNYIIENRTILWWGGMGMSTEQTAFNRLKAGIKAPESGSAARNSIVVSEQIGSQIFIDGWGMICPGDPAKAADFARRAASVSHDGEAIYGAQVVAALVAGAFVERNIDKLFDSAVSLIPTGSTIATLIGDIREWHASSSSWRETFAKVEDNYGYDKFGGGCHMVPNHALIILALLHGNGDFSESLKIVNTCGWDTDCNSANVGAILGVRNGLSAFDGALDWRGPVADRLYLPTADGGRTITDAVIETRQVIHAGRSLNGLTCDPPKNGARFAFEYSGSVQGFRAESDTLIVSNPTGAALVLSGSGRVSTATFIPPDDIGAQGYEIVASPTLYSGQTIRASFKASGPAYVSLFIRYYGEGDVPQTVGSPVRNVHAGQTELLEWQVPSTNGRPIFDVGVYIVESDGIVELEWLTWVGEPSISFHLETNDKMSREQWVNGVSRLEARDAGLMLLQNSGRGVISTGSIEWRNYRASFTVNPHMVERIGVVARYQGLERHYALVLSRDNKVSLVKRYYGEAVLAEVSHTMVFDEAVDLAIEAVGNRITGLVNGVAVLSVHDTDMPLLGGGVGVTVEDGWALLKAARVEGA